MIVERARIGLVCFFFIVSHTNIHIRKDRAVYFLWIDSRYMWMNCSDTRLICECANARLWLSWGSCNVRCARLAFREYVVEVSALRAATIALSIYIYVYALLLHYDCHMWCARIYFVYVCWIFCCAICDILAKSTYTYENDGGIADQPNANIVEYASKSTPYSIRNFTNIHEAQPYHI